MCTICDNLDGAFSHDVTSTLAPRINRDHVSCTEFILFFFVLVKSMAYYHVIGAYLTKQFCNLFYSKLLLKFKCR